MGERLRDAEDGLLCEATTTVFAGCKRFFSSQRDSINDDRQWNLGEMQPWVQLEICEHGIGLLSFGGGVPLDGL